MHRASILAEFVRAPVTSGCRTPDTSLPFGHKKRQPKLPFNDLPIRA
jgi:hypothetical protein